MVGLLRSYGVHRAFGDNWGGEFVREACSASNRLYGIQAGSIVYRTVDANKSQFYMEILTVINSEAVRLPDHKRMLAELVGLGR